MHISSIKQALPTQASSPGKSADVPPGLARRELALPPGIEKKMDDGGVAPAGIAKRFPAAAIVPPEAPVDPSSDGGVLAVEATTNGPTTNPLVDILA
jgi:hypothetical protein